MLADRNNDKKKNDNITYNNGAKYLD